MTMRFIAISDDQCLRFASTPDTNFANAENRFSSALERVNSSIGMFLRNDDNHADATIEDAVHLGIGQFAVFLKPIEQRRPGPRGFSEFRAQRLRQHAWNVFH